MPNRTQFNASQWLNVGFTCSVQMGVVILSRYVSHFPINCKSIIAKSYSKSGCQVFRIRYLLSTLQTLQLATLSLFQLSQCSSNAFAIFEVVELYSRIAYVGMPDIHKYKGNYSKLFANEGCVVEGRFLSALSLLVVILPTRDSRSEVGFVLASALYAFKSTT